HSQRRRLGCLAGGRRTHGREALWSPAVARASAVYPYPGCRAGPALPAKETGPAGPAGCGSWLRAVNGPGRRSEPVQWDPVVLRLVEPLLVVLAVGIVVIEHALGVIAQFFQPQLVVRHIHDVERLFGRRYTLEIGDDRLCAIGSRDVGATPVVVLRNVDFVAGNGVHQPGQAFARVRG